MNTTTLQLLRAIPSVDAILQQAAFEQLAQRIGRAQLSACVREALDQLREDIRAGRVQADPDELMQTIERQIIARAERWRQLSLRPVVNATGVIIHTNLGRVPLSADAVRQVEMVARGYSNLEYDLEHGRRGQRDAHGEHWLTLLMDGHSAVVVNNNAAAVLLVLNTLAEGGEVIISRGELIEIGGSFRIPDIMLKSGCRLREVGTTNRTRLDDYEQAIGEQTRLLLRVHQSNFRISGFAERPSLQQLSALARRYDLPLYEDLGSGCFVDLAAWGIHDEPMVQTSLQAGVDLCSFSGDKLLGGPQCGIIVGKADMIRRLRANPLMRALRPDKMTLAALEATLRSYAVGRATEELPVLQMLSATPAEIRRRALRLIRRVRRRLADRVRLGLKSGHSLTGGGSAPDSVLPTTLITVEVPGVSAAQCQARLRAFHPPIICRIEDDLVLLDLRTVRPDEESVLLSALISVVNHAAVEPGS
ncbi:MAG: L-seryl-tRNA(Sec) selenium transferase [Blastocatellia bacterium]|nr:L-seryl-tRNA(Sec) selenium transferase [Blastocatellia bacterium]